MDLAKTQTWCDEHGQWIVRSGLDVVKGLERRIATAKKASRADEIDDLGLVQNAFRSVGGSNMLGGDVWNAIVRNMLFDVAYYLLESGVRQEWQTCTEYDPIMEAVDAGSIPMVSLLLDHGWKLDHVVNADPANAVMLAARNGDAEMFFFLMEHGALLEQPYRDYELTCDPEGEPDVITPDEVLECAKKGGSQPIIQYVLGHMSK